MDDEMRGNGVRGDRPIFEVYWGATLELEGRVVEDGFPVPDSPLRTLG